MLGEYLECRSQLSEMFERLHAGELQFDPERGVLNAASLPNPYYSNALLTMVRLQRRHAVLVPALNVLYYATHPGQAATSVAVCRNALKAGK